MFYHISKNLEVCEKYFAICVSAIVVSSQCLEIGETRSIVLAIKQLLDEVFVISRIIKVEVRVISRSRDNPLPRP